MRKYSIFFYVLVIFFNTACSDKAEINKNAPSSSYSSEVFRWKMVTTWPSNFPIFQAGAERFAKEVTDRKKQIDYLTLEKEQIRKEY